ncbi:hypothetical protein VDIAB_100935 [Vibrio diabolicus]|nr:hypothetical protein VDIAB_100935 [Vibrio diabolicus]
MPRLRSRVRTSCVAPNYSDMAIAVSRCQVHQLKTSESLVFLYLNIDKFTPSQFLELWV